MVLLEQCYVYGNIVWDLLNNLCELNYAINLDEFVHVGRDVKLFVKNCNQLVGICNFFVLQQVIDDLFYEHMRLVNPFRIECIDPKELAQEVDWDFVPFPAKEFFTEWIFLLKNYF